MQDAFLQTYLNIQLKTHKKYFKQVDVSVRVNL